MFEKCRQTPYVCRGFSNVAGAQGIGAGRHVLLLNVGVGGAHSLQVPMAKPSYKRAERVADQIRMEVADILARKIKDPRIGFVTVTDVDLSPDLRVARVYVTSLQEGQSEDVTLQGLSSAVGFIRGELGRRLDLRYTPELTFCQDVSRKHGDRIDQLLDSLHRQEEERQLPL